MLANIEERETKTSAGIEYSFIISMQSIIM